MPLSSAKRALITGVTGQDGRYLSELLAGKGYEVYGLVRGQANPKVATVLAENPALKIVPGDLTDLPSLIGALEAAQPDEVYNLAAISFVGMSFQQPRLTAEVTGLGALNLLEAVRRVAPDARYYQASSSEMFGKVRESPQNELTPFHPRSPYGCSKVFAHHQTVNYREAYGLHASCGILFNHESPRRGHEFVTRKITSTFARIAAGSPERLALGNLAARRDWGHARDYVEAMWLMLQQDTPDDYVIATGETHSVREFLALTAERCGLDWWDHVDIDPGQLRPAEVDTLCGDATKAHVQLGWFPRSGFSDLVAEMVDEDMKVRV